MEEKFLSLRQMIENRINHFDALEENILQEINEDSHAGTLTFDKIASYNGRLQRINDSKQELVLIISQEYNDWDLMQTALCNWAKETFGDQIHQAGTHSKLMEEIEELGEDFTDLEEYADVMILFVQVAKDSGFTMSDIFNAVRRKFAKNKTRTWEKSGDGKFQHTNKE